MNLTEKSSFFPEYYLNIKNICGENEINKFSNMKSDLERVTYLNDQNFICDNDLILKRKFDGKNDQQAFDIKEKGNLSFKNKKWIEALIFYSNSIIKMPADKKQDLAILYANRSAALYHIENYNESLLDIERAVENGYPKDMMYKLLERKARCQLATKDTPSALETFRNTITAIDNCKLPLEKRQKLEKDAMIMVKMLEKDPTLPKIKLQQDKIKKNKQQLTKSKQFISNAIKVDFNEREGRFVRAGHDVKIGEELLMEDPNVACLLEKFCKSHCQHCFLRTVTPISCLQCSDVIFCSEKCRNEAVYHQYECGILPIIWKSGTSINCHLALRLIASKTLEYFIKIKEKINDELKFEVTKKLPQNDYLRVSSLVRHEDKRNASGFFQLSLMARFLTNCLVETNFFANSKPETKKSDILFISSLILRNLQFVQFNAHEVSELHESKNTGQKTSFIGGAIYPTLALFNHSCDPGIVRYFSGNKIHVNAIKSVDSGLPICENYGPLYTQEPASDRQAKLKDLYWFECNCDACIENWPQFDEMRNDVIRFRCDADEPCNSVIEVPPDVNDLMVKCNQCNQLTNILKGLKAIQDTEMMNKVAKQLYDSGEYKQALTKYIDLLKIMSEVLAPPFGDYCQAQQNIKDCYTNLGNKYAI